MKILLYTFFLCICVSKAKAQILQGTIVYSHHNDTAAVNPDSIYSINNLKQKTFITLGFRPRISHNGNYMAFENGPLANHGSQAAVWLRDLVAAKDSLIIPNNDFIDYYDFSPDDAVLIYDYQCSILSAKINGTNVIDLGCTPCDCYSDHPAVRLSDSVITFHNVHYGLLTKNFDGSNPLLMPHTYPGDLYPVWSPDGQWIAYCKTTPGVVFTSGNYVTNAIYKIAPDGQDSTLLLQLGVADSLTSDPVWSGDMAYIFFIARIQDSLGIYKVKTDGSALYQKIYSFDTTGSINDYWLGLSDAISGTLPVSLTDFSVSRNDKTINLIWHTANETNTSYFNIERCTDGNNFYEIGSVTAKGSNGLSNRYLFTDNELPFTNAGGQSLSYRLKMIDKDGKFTYSKIVSIKISSSFSIKIFPNPAHNVLQIEGLQILRPIIILIKNLSGSIVKKITAVGNKYSCDISNLNAGVYYITIDKDGEIINMKFIKESIKTELNRRMS